MRGSERRALSLAQAKKIFAQQGYTLASMGELARASNVTEAMLYKHFASKKHLYLTVLAEVGEQFLSVFCERVREKARDNLLDTLSTLLVEFRAVALSDPESVQLLLSINSESDDPVIGEMFQAYNAQISALIYDLLKAAQKQGILPPHLDLTAAFWGFASFLFGLQLRVRLHLVHQIDEHTLREMNRLWLVALRIG
jgi:AcrR family transcriptional regulator